jgi:hypothetical protein
MLGLVEVVGFVASSSLLKYIILLVLCYYLGVVWKGYDKLMVL